MKSKVIKKFVLEVGGKEISLNPAEARELFDSLEELFGKKIIREYHDYYRWYPKSWYDYPTRVTPYSHTGTASPIVVGDLPFFETTAGSQLSENNGTVTCRLAAST